MTELNFTRIWQFEDETGKVVVTTDRDFEIVLKLFLDQEVAFNFKELF